MDEKKTGPLTPEEWVVGTVVCGICGRETDPRDGSCGPGCYELGYAQIRGRLAVLEHEDSLEAEHESTMSDPPDSDELAGLRALDRSMESLRARVRVLAEENARLREALRPFAERAGDYDHWSEDADDQSGYWLPPVGLFRAARAALAGKTEEKP